MRVVLAAEGTRGDVHPMLALGDALAGAGHRVTLCAPPDFRADAEERGHAFHPVGEPVRGYLEDHAEATATGGLRFLREARAYARRCIPAQFEALPPVVAGADLVLGAGVQIAASSVAEAYGVPYRYVVYCPTLFESEVHPPFTVSPQRMPAWLNRLAWQLHIGAHVRLLAPVVNDHRARLGLRSTRDLYRLLTSDHPLLAADAELGPAPPDGRLPVQQIPCLHPSAPEPLPTKLASFLDAGPPPVYFGFGSMPDPDPRRTTRILLETTERLGCRALLSAGWARLGDGPLPEGVMAVGGVSHPALFPRVAAVVHHGGAGTTASAARAGVPQQVVPHLLDQHYWGHRVECLGLGAPPLSRRRLSADLLAGRLAQILDNEVVAERAADLGETLRARAARTRELALEALGLTAP